MHLAQLADQLLPCFQPSMQKDVKTAVGYLAKALDCADSQHCPPERYNQPLTTLYQRLENCLRAQSKGAHTIRNTKNAISRLFRLAEAQQLLVRAPLVPTPRIPYRQRPRRSGSSVTWHRGTYLCYAQWPPDLQDAFREFQDWATSPFIAARPAKHQKRLSSVTNYRLAFESYFGYLHHVAHLSPTFDALADLTLITAYVQWHVNECHQRVTRKIHIFLGCLLSFTRQYRPNEDLLAKLLALKQTLPAPTPVYDKDDAWVSTAELSQIGRALWPRHQAHELRQFQHYQRQNLHPGLFLARRAGIALMFQLWSYIPYRSRNMREMQLGENLRKDDHGTWQIVFRGAQLKVATKGGKINEFKLPFPSDLVPVLEDYLTLWHPILLAKAGHPETHVFLTQYGTPYGYETLRRTTSTIVYRYTLKHWHPHIIRTVWATEHISKTGDYLGAAYMLNDRLETVIAKYTHLRDENRAEDIYRLISERNGQGK